MIKHKIGVAQIADLAFCPFLVCRLPNGAEYLFIARDETEVQSWVTAINAAIDGATGEPAPMPTHLPPLPPAQRDGTNELPTSGT